MSKRPFITEYDSPNIVIVPTISFCRGNANPPAKKTKLEHVPSLQPEKSVDINQPIPGITQPPPNLGENSPCNPGTTPSSAHGITPSPNPGITPLPVPGITPPVQPSHVELNSPYMPKSIQYYPITTVNTVPQVLEYDVNPVLIPPPTQNKLIVPPVNITPIYECDPYSNCAVSSDKFTTVPSTNTKNLQSQIAASSKNIPNVCSKADLLTNTNITSWASNYLMGIGQMHKKPVKLNLLSRNSKTVNQGQPKKMDSNIGLNNNVIDLQREQRQNQHKEKPTKDLQDLSKLSIKKSKGVDKRIVNNTIQTHVINKTKDINKISSFAQDISISKKLQKTTKESKNKSPLRKESLSSTRLNYKSNRVRDKSDNYISSSANESKTENRKRRRSCSPKDSNTPRNKYAKSTTFVYKSSKRVSNQETNDESAKHIKELNKHDYKQMGSKSKITFEQIPQNLSREDKTKPFIKSKVNKVRATSPLPSCSYKSKFDTNFNNIKHSKYIEDKIPLNTESKHFDLRSKLSRQNLSAYFNKICRESFDMNSKERDNLIISVPNYNNEQASNSREEKHEKKPKKVNDKKCKKIKLVINVLCESSESSEDEDNESGVHTEDLSFLDDINIDEIVESLTCENKPNSSVNFDNSTMEVAHSASDDECSDASTVHLEELSESQLNFHEVESNLIDTEKREGEIISDTENAKTIFEKSETTLNDNTCEQVQRLNINITLNGTTHKPIIPITEIKQELPDDSPKKGNKISSDKISVFCKNGETAIPLKEIKQELCDNFPPSNKIQTNQENEDIKENYGFIENTVKNNIKVEPNNNIDVLIDSLYETINNSNVDTPESKCNSLFDPKENIPDPIPSVKNRNKLLIDTQVFANAVGNVISSEIISNVSNKPGNIVNSDSDPKEANVVDYNECAVLRDHSLQINHEDVVTKHLVAKETLREKLSVNTSEPEKIVPKTIDVANIVKSTSDCEQATEESKPKDCEQPTEESKSMDSEQATEESKTKDCEQPTEEPKSMDSEQATEESKTKDCEQPSEEPKSMDCEQAIEESKTIDCKLAIKEFKSINCEQATKSKSTAVIIDQNLSAISNTSTISENDFTDVTENVSKNKKGDVVEGNNIINTEKMVNSIVTQDKQHSNDKENNEIDQKLTRLETNKPKESALVKLCSLSPIVSPAPNPSNKSATEQTNLTNLEKGELNWIDLLEKRMLEYLHETYKVSSVINRGGFSKIFLCNNTKGQKYAVKVLGPKGNRYHNGVLKEKMLMAMQKDIPKENLNLVYLVNGFSLGPRWCFLMEYCYTNLAKVLAVRLLHVNEVQNLSRQLVAAVNVLRHNKVIHADIKPGHILLNSTHTILKLCAFDEAHYYEDRPLRPNIGTVNYRAPEVILGYSSGYSIDVWSTGLVMFEMATGRQLLPGIYNNDILFKQICTFGTIPLDMLKQSLFSNAYFDGPCFIKRFGPKKRILKNQASFIKNNIMTSTIYNNYMKIWAKKVSKKQQTEEMAKIRSFINLLEQMLTIHPNNRLPIEFVYTNRFLFQVSH